MAVLRRCLACKVVSSTTASVACGNAGSDLPFLGLEALQVDCRAVWGISANSPPSASLTTPSSSTLSSPSSTDRINSLEYARVRGLRPHNAQRDTVPMRFLVSPAQKNDVDFGLRSGGTVITPFAGRKQRPRCAQIFPTRFARVLARILVSAATDQLQKRPPSGVPGSGRFSAFCLILINLCAARVLWRRLGTQERRQLMRQSQRNTRNSRSGNPSSEVMMRHSFGFKGNVISCVLWCVCDMFG